MVGEARVTRGGQHITYAAEAGEDVQRVLPMLAPGPLSHERNTLPAAAGGKQTDEF